MDLVVKLQKRYNHHLCRKEYNAMLPYKKRDPRYIPTLLTNEWAYGKLSSLK